MAFKDMLKFFREREGWSQSELAQKLGLSTSTISMYEVGKREPNFEIEERIADLFNTDLNTLRGNDIEPRPDAVSQDPNEEKLVSAYRSFNALGRERLMDYVGYLESKPENLSLELFPSTKEEGDGLSSGGIA